MTAGNAEDHSRYLQLARDRPELFSNPEDGGFRILLGEDEIAAAEEQAATRLDRKDLPRSWSKVGIAYEDEYVVVLRDAVAFPDGHLGTYMRVLPQGSAAGGVGVLPVWGDKVLLVRHFRHATRTQHLEIPRGFWIEGLGGEEVARTELREELGVEASFLVSLGRVHPNTGLTSEAVELFGAGVRSRGVPNREQGISEIVALGVEELEGLIGEGAVTDTFTIAAYTRAKLRGILTTRPPYE